MKLEVTELGIFDADGKEMPVGHTFDVDSDGGNVPNQYANKVRILAMDGKGKKAEADGATDEASKTDTDNKPADDKVAITNPKK